MKKSEFIQILGQHQPEDTRVLGFLLFKGQDSEAIRQLKSILKHREVGPLPDDAELPSEAMNAVKKTIEEATNADVLTKVVIERLRNELSRSTNTSKSESSTNIQSSTNSNAVTVTTSSAPTSSEPRPALFQGVATHAVENIMSCLPGHDKGIRAFFRVIAATKADDSYESVRQGVVNGMQAQFLHDVADAEMKSAEAILKLVMVNQPMLKTLLTTSKNIIQKNGLIVTGTALEIALKCWDWSSCRGGQEEMAEMLMRYMRMLPEGEELIQTTFKKLFPNGNEVHQENQTKRADEFAQSIFEPLAKTLLGASDEDIELVYAITDKEGSEVDDYINTILSKNKLWQAMMEHFDALRDFMTQDTVYNPHYLIKAFGIVNKKYETEKWGNLSKGFDRLTLLTIHGVGGIQASSPTIIGMLFARRGIWEFYAKAPRKQFKVDRDCKFTYGSMDLFYQYGSGDVFAQSGGGVLMCSKMFWAWPRPCRGARSGTCTHWDFAHSLLGIYLSDKNTALGSFASEILFQCQSTNNESVSIAIAPR